MYRRETNEAVKWLLKEAIGLEFYNQETNAQVAIGFSAAG